LHGKEGEWPWFINAKKFQVIDWYQVYSVHQDPMVVLFLLAAWQKGLNEADHAIRISVNWLFRE